MENSPILISCSELFIQRISSVSTEQLQNHVERSQEQNLERSNPGYESARRTPRENEMKREELTQVFGGYSQSTGLL